MPNFFTSNFLRQFLREKAYFTLKKVFYAKKTILRQKTFFMQIFFKKKVFENCRKKILAKSNLFRPENFCRKKNVVKNCAHATTQFLWDISNGIGTGSFRTVPTTPPQNTITFGNIVPTTSLGKNWNKFVISSFLWQIHLDHIISWSDFV